MTTLPDDLRLTGPELNQWHDNLHLASGNHQNPDDGMCVMEAIAWITGGDFDDAPACVHPVIRAFAISWNDSLSGAGRDRLLKPLMWDMAGTAAEDPAVGEQLAWMATDWLVRVQAPAWLRLAGLSDQADTLAGLTELNAYTTPGIMPTLRAVREDSRAAWASAWASAGAAAGDAAGDAAWASAGAAARDAARDAAWASAWAAVRDEAWAAAGDAAWASAGAAVRDAAKDAAWASAGAAARDAAKDAAWASAWAAAGAALQPTKVELQGSAVDLLQRMCAHAKAAR